MRKLSLLSILTIAILAKVSTVQLQITLFKVAKYNQSCSPMSLLVPTICEQYDRTVRCSSDFLGTCVCNTGDDDAYFSEEEQACVGLVGGLCLTDATSLGRKICTENADCFPVGPGTIGSCACLDGWKENADKKCENDDEFTGTPGTLRPTTTRKPLVPVVTTTTRDPNATPPPPPPGDSGSGTLSSVNTLLALVSTFILLGCKLL
ncbi:uncharacterized protein LOC110847513 [Folsomia candida]|uniref:Uncharacterized protein n=1 Tax=Folsomia candida TaxID=158441 RepID=A0A226EIQ7_FOLCA|nr:uncharacterized protein LOC110847513 [Folsomia candida]OXA56997.1 hypothetical protein Fcan01_08363 [Folsomia candida]